MTIVIVTYRGAYLRLANNPNAERQAPHVEPAIAGKVFSGSEPAAAERKGSTFMALTGGLTATLTGCLTASLMGG